MPLIKIFQLASLLKVQKQNNETPLILELTVKGAALFMANSKTNGVLINYHSLKKKIVSLSVVKLYDIDCMLV